MKGNKELTKEFCFCLSTTIKKKKSLLKNAADGRELFCCFGVKMTEERRTGLQVCRRCFKAEL